MNDSEQFSFLIPLASLIGAGILLGTSTNLAKVANGMDLTPLTYLTWSLLGPTLILGTISFFRKVIPPFNKKAVIYYAISAFLSVAGANLLFFEAIPHVGVSYVALTITLPPLLTYIGALLLKMERFSWQRAAGVLFALLGALFLAFQKVSAPDSEIFWIILPLLGAGLLAGGNIYRTLKWPEKASPESLAPGMMAAATIMLVLFAFLSKQSIGFQVDRSEILLISAQAIVFSGQFFLLFILQKSGGPVFLSLLGAVGAIFGIPVAILLLNESPPEGLIVSSILVAIGVFLMSTSKSSKFKDLSKGA